MNIRNNPEKKDVDIYFENGIVYENGPETDSHATYKMNPDGSWNFELQTRIYEDGYCEGYCAIKNKISPYDLPEEIRAVISQEYIDIWNENHREELLRIEWEQRKTREEIMPNEEGYEDFRRACDSLISVLGRFVNEERLNDYIMPTTGEKSLISRLRRCLDEIQDWAIEVEEKCYDCYEIDISEVLTNADGVEEPIDAVSRLKAMREAVLDCENPFTGEPSMENWKKDYDYIINKIVQILDFYIEDTIDN